MHTMIRAVAALLALALGGAAHAQWVQPPQRNFFVVFYGGLSGGGDTLAQARIVSQPPFGGVYSSTEEIDAGGLLQFGGGLLWQPVGVPLAVQGTVGYQFDSISADNGDITWTRVPIELLAFYTGVPNLRFGGGARFVRSAELEFDLFPSETYRFKDTNGFVLEAGWRFAPNFWLNARYVDEQYEIESVNGIAVLPAGKVSGQSFGVNLLVQF